METTHATDDAELALRRLRWRARRGLLENDLFLSRFLERRGASLDAGQREVMRRLLQTPDPELLEILLGRAPAADAESQVLVDQIRAC